MAPPNPYNALSLIKSTICSTRVVIITIKVTYIQQTCHTLSLFHTTTQPLTKKIRYLVNFPYLVLKCLSFSSYTTRSFSSTQKKLHINDLNIIIDLCHTKTHLEPKRVTYKHDTITCNHTIKLT